VKILFASYRDYYPDRVDGAIVSMHALLEMLMQRGHSCEAIVGVDGRKRLRVLAYRLRRMATGRRVAAWPDRRSGYPTYRAWEQLIPSLLEQRIERGRPDIIVTQLEGSERIVGIAAAARVPIIQYAVDSEMVWEPHANSHSRWLAYVSSSAFVAERARARLNVVSPVIYPIIHMDRYRSATRDPRYITFITPAREKGLDVAIEVARLLPHRAFLFQRTWPIPDDALRGLLARLAPLRNVTLGQTTIRMSDVYGKTQLLLMPSQWEEGFGRVAIEAQANGVPVVASAIGGIPEAVGHGGLLLPATSPPNEWAAAIERVLGDPDMRERLSRDALANTRRVEFKPEVITDRFLEVARAHTERCLSAHAADRTPGQRSGRLA
jgi:glycosyltransferase involved in cell wall biosynthesis